MSSSDSRWIRWSKMISSDLFWVSIYSRCDTHNPGQAEQRILYTVKKKRCRNERKKGFSICNQLRTLPNRSCHVNKPFYKPFYIPQNTPLERVYFKVSESISYARKSSEWSFFVWFLEILRFSFPSHANFRIKLRMLGIRVKIHRMMWPRWTAHRPHYRKKKTNFANVIKEI